MVFNLSNIKFINYVKPILNYLDDCSYCFQVGSDKNLSKAIENLGYNVLDIKNDFHYFRHFKIYFDLYLTKYLNKNLYKVTYIFIFI